MTIEPLRITGQESFDSYLTESVQLATALVNRLATTHAFGRAVAIPASPGAAREAILDVVEELGRPRRTGLGDAEAGAVQRVAGELRAAFDAAIGGDLQAAADVLNTLLSRHHAVPNLHGHPGETLTIQFHHQDATATDAWAANAAAGLALAIGLGHADRLGACQAADCDRVFFDATRNASRRFCGLTCQNRAKAAAYRARLGSASG